MKAVVVLASTEESAEKLRRSIDDHLRATGWHLHNPTVHPWPFPDEAPENLAHSGRTTP